MVTAAVLQRRLGRREGQRPPARRLRQRTLSALLAGVATVLCATQASWTATSSHGSGDVTFVAGLRDAGGKRSFFTVSNAAPKNSQDTLDDFEKARERIRRIQLGLGPDDPLPPEGSPVVDAKLKLAEAEDVKAVNVNISAQMPGNEDEIAKGAAAQLIEGMDALPAAPPPQRLGEDGAYIANAENETEEVQDAFAGYADDVEELKPDKDGKKTGPNFFQLLVEDLGVIRFPPASDVLNQFGIVIGLVAFYTGFIAVVDFSSQQALGQVFQDFYKAARQEMADLG